MENKGFEKYTEEDKKWQRQIIEKFGISADPEYFLVQVGNKTWHIPKWENLSLEDSETGREIEVNTEDIIKMVINGDKENLKRYKDPKHLILISFPINKEKE